MRSLCRVCLRASGLTRRGNVWHHRARSAYGPLLDRCPGAGAPPLGRPGPELDPIPGQRLAPSPLAREHPAGTVYLLHLAEPFAHARHYLGWASPGNLHARLAHHGTERGANLLLHVAKAGITWELARTWPGDRNRERVLKARGQTRRCPVCRPELSARLLAEVARRAP